MLGHIYSYLGVHVIPGLGSPGRMEYLLEPSPNQVMRPTLNRSLSFHFLHVGIFSLFYELKYGCENIFSAHVCGFVGVWKFTLAHFVLFLEPRSLVTLYVAEESFYVSFLTRFPPSPPHTEGLHLNCTSLTFAKPGIQHPVPPN